MRRYFLITILVILLLLPNVNVSAAPAFKLTGVKSSFAYSFSSLSTGSYPMNESWITFSVLNNDSTFSDQVTNTSMGNGLDVFTASMNTASYLNINMSTFQSFTLYLNFSWNSNGYYGVTEDNLKFSSGGSQILSVAFGPLDSFDTRVKNASTTTTLGPEPSPNSVTTLSLSYNSTQNDSALLEMKQAGGNITAFPVRVNFPPANISSLSLEIGGDYSNLTVFNISERKGARLLPTENGNPEMLHSSYFAVAGPYSPDTSASVRPVMDTNVNSVIYYSTNSKLVSFDYYNSSFHNLTQSVPRLSGGIEYKGLVYYWQNGSDLSLFSIDTTTLSCSMTLTGIDMGGNVNTMFSGNNAYFYNSTGSLAIFNLITNKIDAWSNVTNGASDSSYQVLSSGINASCVQFLVYSNSTREIMSIDYNSTTLNKANAQVSGFSFLTGSINVTSHASGISGLESIFKVSDNTSQMYLASISGNIYPSPENLSFYRALYIGTSSALISMGGEIYSFGENTTLTYSGLTAPDANYSVSADRNMSTMILLKGNEVDIYYDSSSIPLSNSGMKVTGSSSYLARGSTYINVTVESSLMYSLGLLLNGTTYMQYNSSSFLVNSSRLSDGTHSIKITGTNIAGYTSQFNSTLEVDNANPTVSINEKSGQYISNSTLISFSVSDKLPIRKVEAVYLSNALFFNGDNGTFDLESGLFTGSINLTFTVTDNFGLMFNFSYAYTVVGSNSKTLMSIWNGEYINTTALNLSWTGVGNATYYRIETESFGTYVNTTTAYDYSRLDLPEGKTVVKLYAHLLDNVTAFAAEANVTVLSYSPELSFSSLPNGIYSFYGNSGQDQFNTSITSNISARITLKITDPSGKLVLNSTGRDSLVVNISGRNGNLGLNGAYTLNISAVSLSGTTSYSSFQMEVNNSVPTSPVVSSSLIYTNRSYAGISLEVIEGLNYSAKLYHNGTNVAIPIADLSNFSLSYGTGNYTLLVEAYSESGNHNSSVANIAYYVQGPVIEFSISRDVVNTNYTYVDYNLKDSVPLSHAVLTINGTVRNLALPGGSIMVDFSHNGMVNLSITAVDLCGNLNSTSNITVNVSYYIHVVSAKIRYTDSGGIWHFYMTDRGNGLGRVRITWYVDGNAVSQGHKLNFTLKYGINTVKAVLQYQGKTTDVSRKIIVTGLIPYVAAPVIAAVFISYRKLGTNRNAEEIREIILSGLGNPVRDAIRSGRKKKVPAGVMKNHIKRLQRDGDISLESDPDGMKYIMPSKTRMNGGSKPRS